MKTYTYIVTAKHTGAIKRTASWELEAESEIVAHQKIRTREEDAQWPIGTVWSTNLKTGAS